MYIYLYTIWELGDDMILSQFIGFELLMVCTVSNCGDWACNEQMFACTHFYIEVEIWRSNVIFYEIKRIDPSSWQFSSPIKCR